MNRVIDLKNDELELGEHFKTNWQQSVNFTKLEDIKQSRTDPKKECSKHYSQSYFKTQ